MARPRSSCSWCSTQEIAPRSTSPTRQAPSATAILPRTCYSKFKKKANKELEEKNRMLQEDPVLFQLYKDLVVSQVISAEEFWANRTPWTTPIQAASKESASLQRFWDAVNDQASETSSMDGNSRD
ncbi:hypothetical protein AAFF_G00036650 [Aldrovandia affinis]|uniref:BSD domain-containing protein n=1 Tax=Aldrovandia affinis TaxID=143900 RepID=A0AAD7VXZ3_9TELE|nr:hypothetical protein AAFF_G00036650 [Aldrovandia affinis]